MYYKINVAQRAAPGKPPRHVFATAENSVQYKDHAVAIAKTLQQVYPVGEFSITISRCETTGEDIPWEGE